MGTRGSEWMRVRVPATKCPRISRTFLKEERLAMGDAWFRQEYLCQFVESNGGVFDRDLVEAALDEELEALDV
jgi:hypothetical protein